MLNKFFVSDINQSFIKKFNIPNAIKINYILLKYQTIIYFSFNSNNNKIYFFLPKYLNFIFKNHILYFFNSNLNFENNNNKFFTFFSNFNFYLKKIKKFFFKSIYIKGTNFKITFLENFLNILKLKLGYSHLIYLNIPSNITIKLLKKKLILKSSSNSLLGNFCSLLYYYRPINIFTGKGLLIKKRKKFKLKEYSKKI